MPSWKDCTKMKSVLIFASFLSIIGAIIGLIKLGDQHMESQIRARVQDYEELRRVKREVENTTSLLENILALAWKVNACSDRELMSKRLNVLMLELTKYICRLKEATSVTKTGSYCSSKEYITDRPLAKAMAELLRGQSVGSFGEGPDKSLIIVKKGPRTHRRFVVGKYKEIILASGLVTKFDAYDGTLYIENDTNGSVKYLDLTIPHYGLQIYDWTISLEVAEHIPAEFEDIFLENLVRYTKYGIILSWAVPAQTGRGHVNLRTAEYVQNKMKGYCFDWDEKTSKICKEKQLTIGCAEIPTSSSGITIVAIVM